MPVYLVALRLQQPTDDRALIASARAAFGLDLEAAYEERRYLLAGELDDVVTDRLVSTLLADQGSAMVASFPLEALRPTDPGASWAIDIVYRPGLDDNEGASIRTVAEHVGLMNLHAVRVLRRMYLRGNLQYDAVEELARVFLAQDLVEAALISLPDDTTASAAFYDKLIGQLTRTPSGRTVHLRDADDPALSCLSHEHDLALDVEEMQAIQTYFREASRSPTSYELQTLAESWSGHGSQKMFTALVRYQTAAVADPEREPDIPAAIDGILKTCLTEPTRAINPPWLLSAFGDDVGIVAVGDDAVSFKVVTHQPSTLDRSSSATTGMGDAARDVLGVPGQPIANLDVFCLGAQDQPRFELLREVRQPRQATDDVVASLRDDGDKLGVPTIARTLLYDEAYIRNPLVFSGTIGLARRGQQPPGAVPGDAVVVIDYQRRNGDPRGTAAKRVVDIILQARDQRLYHAIANCAPGGLSSVIGAMGQKTGVWVELAEMAVKDPSHEPWQVWLGKAQERMVLAVPPSALDTFLELCTRGDVPATSIGRFTADRRLLVTYAGQVLVDLAMVFLHDGRPQREMQAVWTARTRGREREPDADPIAIRWALHQLLAHPNIASQESIVGNTPMETPVLQPRHNARAGLAVGFGINPRYGLIDPDWMALASCDKALRSVVAVGGDPYKTSLLANFCWGDLREPDGLASLVRAAIACRDVAATWSTPFLSGQASSYNVRRDAAEQGEPLLPTLLISALAVVPDAMQAVTSSLQEEGNLLYLVGRTRNELGGSHYLMLRGEIGASVPKVDLIQARRTLRALHAAIDAGRVRACHHLSEGGLAVAAAAMSFRSNLGLDLDLATAIADEDCNDAVLLFSETPSRFLVEVRASDSAAFGSFMEGVEVALVGFVTAEPVLRVDGFDGREMLHEPMSVLKAVWQQQMPQG